MIKKIIKIYAIMITIIITFTKKNENDASLEYKLLRKEIIKIKDIVEYIASNREIKTIKFLTIFIIAYPFIGFLVLSAIITTLWSIWYLLKIKIYKKNKNYIPMSLEKEIFKIHSEISIIKILKLILIQIPKIKGFSNAYKINKFKKSSKFGNNIKIFLNNLKNILIFSISPSRLFFIVDTCLYIKSNIKEKYFWYYLKKYIYGQLYRNEMYNISEAKKMKILKKKNNDLEFNPMKGAQKIGTPVVTMCSKKSVNGKHWGFGKHAIGDNKYMFAQGTGTVPKDIEKECQTIQIATENYKKDEMYLMLNYVVDDKNFKKDFNPKIMSNMGLHTEEKEKYLMAMIMEKRIQNKDSIICEEPTKFEIQDLEKKNIFEHLVNGVNPWTKEKLNRDEMREYSERVLNWRAKMDQRSSQALENLGREERLNFHINERKREIDEILKEHDFKNII